MQRGDIVNGAIDSYCKNRKRAERQLRFRFGEPWCKMVKRELVEKNNIKFDETTIHEDTIFSYLVGYYAKTIEVSSYALCTIMSRENSLSNVLGLEKRMERLTVFGRYVKFFESNNIKVDEKRHIYELVYFWLHDKAYYKKGYDFLVSIGFKKWRINVELISKILSFIGDAVVWRIKRLPRYLHRNAECSQCD